MYQYFCYTVTLSAVAAYSIKHDNDDKIDATTFFILFLGLMIYFLSFLSSTELTLQLCYIFPQW